MNNTEPIKIDSVLQYLNADSETERPLSIPSKVSEFSDHYFKWLYPETRQVKLPLNAKIFPADGETIRKGSSVTILTGDLIRSKTAHNDPGICRLIHAAKTISAHPSICETISPNFLNRNLQLKDISIPKRIEMDRALAEQDGRLADELERETEFNINKLLRIHVKHELANCQGLCIFAISTSSKLEMDDINFRMMGILNGEHAYLVLSTRDDTKSIVYDPWSGAIMPSTWLPHTCRGTTIFELFENGNQKLYHVPIVEPMNAKHKLEMIYQWPERKN